MNKEIKRLDWWIDQSQLLTKMAGLGGTPVLTADKAFIAYSERGKQPDFKFMLDPLRYHQLNEAKRQQGIMLEEWEKGILENSFCYWTLLGGEDPKEIMPCFMVDFIKKEMFKGIDKDLIENVYQEVLRYWTWWRRLWFHLKRYFNNMWG